MPWNSQLSVSGEISWNQNIWLIIQATIQSTASVSLMFHFRNSSSYKTCQFNVN